MFSVQPELFVPAANVTQTSADAMEADINKRRAPLSRRFEHRAPHLIKVIPCICSADVCQHERDLPTHRFDSLSKGYADLSGCSTRRKACICLECHL